MKSFHETLPSSKFYKLVLNSINPFFFKKYVAFRILPHASMLQGHFLGIHCADVQEHHRNLVIDLKYNDGVGRIYRSSDQFPPPPIFLWSLRSVFMHTVK